MSEREVLEVISDNHTELPTAVFMRRDRNRDRDRTGQGQAGFGWNGIGTGREHESELGQEGRVGIMDYWTALVSL